MCDLIGTSHGGRQVICKVLCKSRQVTYLRYRRDIAFWLECDFYMKVAKWIVCDPNATSQRSRKDVAIYYTIFLWKSPSDLTAMSLRHRIWTKMRLVYKSRQVNCLRPNCDIAEKSQGCRHVHCNFCMKVAKWLHCDVAATSHLDKNVIPICKSCQVIYLRPDCDVAAKSQWRRRGDIAMASFD